LPLALSDEPCIGPDKILLWLLTAGVVYGVALLVGWLLARLIEAVLFGAGL
jgi:hypothetical protein